jgi:hypothetical protein
MPKAAGKPLSFGLRYLRPPRPGRTSAGHSRRNLNAGADQNTPPGPPRAKAKCPGGPFSSPATHPYLARVRIGPREITTTVTVARGHCGTRLGELFTLCTERQ